MFRRVSPRVTPVSRERYRRSEDLGVVPEGRDGGLEVLEVLLGEGLVEHVPRVGYSVAKLGFAEFRELYDVRAALEVSVLRQAVLRATAEDDLRVQETHDAMRAAMEVDDERAYHSESRRFHMALIAPARMQRLGHMYEAAWNMTEPARPMSRVDTGGRQLFYDDHDRMLAAFVDRDAEELVRESQLHYEHLKTANAAFRADPEVFRGQPGDG